MKSKTEKRINGGIAIYYGISSLLVGVGMLIAFFVWLYKVFTGQKVFALGTCFGLLILCGITLFIGYSILRVGYEEMEEK